MFVSAFKTRFKPKLIVPGKTTSSSQHQEASEEAPDYATADDGNSPQMNTKRVYDRDGGDFYISY